MPCFQMLYVLFTIVVGAGCFAGTQNESTGSQHAQTWAETDAIDTDPAWGMVPAVGKLYYERGLATDWQCTLTLIDPAIAHKGLYAITLSSCVDHSAVVPGQISALDDTFTATFYDVNADAPDHNQLKVRYRLHTSALINDDIALVGMCSYGASECDAKTPLDTTTITDLVALTSELPSANAQMKVNLIGMGGVVRNDELVKHASIFEWHGVDAFSRAFEQNIAWGDEGAVVVDNQTRAFGLVVKLPQVRLAAITQTVVQEIQRQITLWETPGATPTPAR